MNTTGDIKSRLKTQLQMVLTSTIFTDATLEAEIYDAYLWCTGKYPFPELEKSSFTQTTTDYYYDLPSQYQSDSLTRVVVNSQPYDVIDFDDWLKYKHDNPTRTDEYLAACYGRQYFLFPTPSVASLEIIIWGLIQAPVLSFPNGLTIFSNSEAMMNEAVMRKAKSSLLASKNKQSEADREETRAGKILAEGWDNILGRRSRFKRKDAPYFNIPNLFPESGSGQASIGNFTRRS